MTDPTQADIPTALFACVHNGGRSVLGGTSGEAARQRYGRKQDA